MEIKQHCVQAGFGVILLLYFVSIVCKSYFVLFGIEHCVDAGSLVPKLVGEKKTQSDDVQSMSANVFFVLYPALADYIVSVLKCDSCSHVQPTAQYRASEMSSLPHPGDASQTIDVTEMSLKTNNAVPVATSPLLFPVLSLLCRLSPGLEVTDEGKK